MTGFAVYSSDHEPQCLYTDGDPNCKSAVRRMVQVDNNPLEVIADLEQQRILWLFRAERETKAARIGYFVAAYKSGDGDLIRGFEQQLRGLHYHSDWRIPHTEELRWETGFQLWRIPPELPGLNRDYRREFVEEVVDTDQLVEVGMETYHHALRVIKLFAKIDAPCTVAVTQDEDTSVIDGVDLLLRVGEFDDFEPISDAAKGVISSDDDAQMASAGESSPANESDGEREVGAAQALRVGLVVGIVGVIGAAGVSLAGIWSRDQLGLSVLGALVASVVAIPLLTGVSTGRDDLADGPMPQPNRTRRINARLIILLYGGTLGLIFPTADATLRTMISDTGWFSSLSGFPAESAMSAVMYTVVAATLSVLLVVASSDRVDELTPKDNLISRMLIAHAVLGTFLFITVQIELLG